MRAYARRKQCKDSQKLNGYKKLPCILRENLLENRDGTYGHKKRSTAVLQPLLTLNLIL